MLLKILIVDDEEMTREGIIKRIPWINLGVGNMERADDGINALKVLAYFQPDILLTDVRMPRMDGVELSYRIRETLPDCKIIFMSGYSDKEYLKSAIKLKAIDYVEKPININELKIVIEKTAELCINEQMKKQQELAVSSTIKASEPIIKNEIALQLTNRYCNTVSIKEYIHAVGLDIQDKDCFNSVLIKIPSIKEIDIEKLDSLKTEIADALINTSLNCGLHGIFGFKDDGYFIIHLYSRASDCHQLSAEKLNNFCCVLLDNIKKYHQFFIAIGTRVIGYENIYHSYDTAVSAMQRSFFKEYNSILSYVESNIPPYTFNSELLCTFENILLNGRKEEALFLVKSLSSELRRHDNTLVVTIKDIFFKLTQILLNLSAKNQVDTFKEFESDNFIWEFILSTNTLIELEKFLTGKIDVYYALLKEETESRGIVKEIIKYIQKHYKNEDLSINSIREFINLSQTYICSLFKEETGKTINQYITEYRIEKSKLLLKDIRLRVSEVSSAVGYTDANYFAKLFRKITGQTPSEYREKDIP